MKNVCRNGHAYTPDNVRICKRGRRVCLQCQRDASRRKKGSRVPQGAPALSREEQLKRLNERTPTFVAAICRSKASQRNAESVRLWDEWLCQRSGKLPRPCAWNHPIEPNNVYLHRQKRDGKIYHHCRECARIRTREWKKARKGRVDVFDLIQVREPTEKERERERIAAALRRFSQPQRSEC